MNGVSLFDDDTILGNLDLICGRMKQLLEVIGTLRQFSKLGAFVFSDFFSTFSAVANCLKTT